MEALRLESPSLSRTTPDPRRLAKLFRSLGSEHGFEPLRIEGVVPPDLRGTLFRNGPGMFENHGEAYTHWFEGDGAVSGVRFENGSASGAIRLVESEGLLEERRRGRPLHGSVAPWLSRFRRGFGGKFKNVANTNVMHWQERLFALVESSPPTELSAEDLGTIGETDLGGQVKGPFSAHPHYVASRNALYNFGVRPGRRTWLDCFELPQDPGKPARRLTSVELPAPVMLHDFIATDRHLVFFVSPARVVVWRALLMVGDFASLFRWQPEHGTEVIVVPIDEPERVVRFSTDAFYQWHFANAFERDDEIVVDFVKLPELRLANLEEQVIDGETPDGKYSRARIDLARRRLSVEELWDTPCEFPRIDERRGGGEHRFAYMLATDSNEVAKLDLRTGESWRHDPGPNVFISEPVFVPRCGGSAEDDGYLLAHCYDALADAVHTTVVDAKNPQADALCRVHFDHHLPPTFHGLWVSG